MAFGLTDTDDAMGEVDAGSPVAIVYPDREPGQLGTLFIPNTLAMIKGAPHPDTARSAGRSNSQSRCGRGPGRRSERSDSLAHNHAKGGQGGDPGARSMRWRLISRQPQASGTEPPIVPHELFAD